MLWLINFFKSIADLVVTLVSMVINTLVSIVELVLMIPSYVTYIVKLINSLPNFVYVFIVIIPAIMVIWTFKRLTE